MKAKIKKEGRLQTNSWRLQNKENVRRLNSNIRKEYLENDLNSYKNFPGFHGARRKTIWIEMDLDLLPSIG